MKYSKQLSLFQRKRKWGAYISITSGLKLNRQKNTFETFCKNADKWD